MNSMVKIIINNFGNSTDIVYRKLNNISYIYLESVSSDDKVSNFINKSITNISNTNNLLECIKDKIYSSHITTFTDINDCYYYLTSGYTCIFVDNDNKILAIETKATLDRGINESNSEPIIRGPKDSFTENHSINLGLIRKRIKDYNLHIKDILVGRRTKTKISITYIKDIAKIKNINYIINTINKIDIDGVIDSGYIKNYLEKNYNTSFPLSISTERPDLVSQNLLNGKIAIIVENSPVALIVPACLDDFLKSSEDYYQKASNATFSRILRYIAFFISILTPALYISLMTFNQEMIPDQLLISLAGQRNQVPFPTFVEVLIFIITFEILREADIRSPSVSGASMSIVGALVLGDAAVTAGIVSPIVIIVVAITSICELVFSDIDMSNAIRQWRLIFILSTIFTGLIGILIAMLVLIIKLSSIETYDVPYLTPISPLNRMIFNDSIILKKINKRKKRPSYLTNNITKAGEK